jgi:hypothetical protein
MSLNTLKIASDGYLKKGTKIVLVIAVAGYLNFSETPAPIIKPTKQTAFYGGAGTQEKQFRKIIIEDSELIAIVEITLKTVII